jgi:ribosomal protein S18 acetylase RimI-like enzyme
MTVVIRKARPDDRDKVVWVESKATPGLRYVDRVWEMFLGDQAGDWSVAELDGEMVGCGKYTILPDGSAWLETLRVVPHKQRLGVGKRFYEHWLALAQAQGVRAVRMYTGTGNVASKGLAERFGLRVAGLYKEARRPCDAAGPASVGGFAPVRDPAEAVALLMPLGDPWGRHLVMNRTFYEFTPVLCGHLAEAGMVYADSHTGSVVALGSRFMPEDALHIGVMAGDLRACLDFAAFTGAARRVGRLNIQWPPTGQDVCEALTAYGFETQRADFIVMERRLDAGRPVAG